MPALSLLIGNKNYSSWSLRPWLLLAQTGLEFEEVRVAFGSSDFAERVRAREPGQRRLLVVRPTTLEDVFLALTGASLEATQ